MVPSDRVAHTVLEPDAWYQDQDTGEYTIDCPRCGSPAPISAVIEHGRCSAYLDRADARPELDTETMDCTAKLWFELGYTDDSGTDPTGSA